MEKIPTNEMTLSAEQQERQNKFAELAEAMSSLSESFSNSDQAYEVASSINDFKKNFEKQGLNLRDYLLGGGLLLSEDGFDDSKYKYYDTEDKKIESFIRNLQNKKTA